METPTKTCKGCDESLPLDMFYKHHSNKDGLAGKCKMCRKAQSRTWAKGPGSSSVHEAQVAFYNRRRALVSEAKNVPCADCGKRYPSYVMDFDHRDPSQKEFGIGACANYGLDRLLAEIAKCEVVCANCHRERTHSSG